VAPVPGQPAARAHLLSGLRAHPRGHWRAAGHGGLQVHGREAGRGGEVCNKTVGLTEIFLE